MPSGGQAQGLGSPEEEDVGGDQKGGRVEAPEGPVRNMSRDERATEAVLTFLRDTKVRCIVTVAPPEEEKEGEIVDGGRTGPTRPRLYFSLSLCHVFPSIFFVFWRIWGEGEGGAQL